jgi:hypothetical protein
MQRGAACLYLMLACLPAAAPAWGLERVELKQGERQTSIAGELVIEAADGGLLVLGPDGTLWTVKPDDLISRITDEEPFEPLSPDDLAKQVLSELPSGFESHQTAHYLICYNTSREYAQWCGGLFERLYRGFTNYWSRRGFKPQEPRFPLVAVIFADGDDYRRHARTELGDSAESIIGYYSLSSNRMTMYDLTGIQSLRQPGDRRGSAQEINRMLSRPEAERTVATIIHEATHQISFNCGLQTRLADNPLWVSEGLAVFFETPDLGSGKGWRTIGGVNQVRLNDFRGYLARRPANSLQSLLANDDRLRDPLQAADAYAEAWALNYFLLRAKPRQYEAYLKVLAAKRPFIWDTPEKRLAEFQSIFGDDLAVFDAEFLRHMSKVR